MRRVIAAAALLAGSLSSVATSYAICQQAIWPMDGSTSVPVDIVIEVDTQQDLQSLGSLHEAMTLVAVPTGETVPFDYALDGSVVRVTPAEPLAADTTYRFEGVDLGATASAHQLSPWRVASPRVIEFSTGGEPTVLGWGQQEGAIWVVFSEAVDEVTIEVDGEPLEVLWLEDHIVQVAFPDYPESLVIDGTDYRDPGDDFPWMSLEHALGSATCW